MAFSTINKSSLYQNTTLYTGNNSYGHSITGVGFQPDLVWIKARNTAKDSNIYDAVRGTDKTLESNTTDAERTAVNLLGSFDSDGFTVDDDSQINGNYTYASWNWKADNSAGSANTDGDIASTVSVNTTAGFSIVKYTGELSATGTDTIGHGLGVAPKLIIIKCLSHAEGWHVWQTDLTSASHQLNLNGDSTQTDKSGNGSMSAPTTSVFSVNYSGQMGVSGKDYIAYCFAENNSKVFKTGHYVGNANADGIFINTMIKPSLVIIKQINQANDWFMWDNKTSPTNITNAYLRANTDGTAGSYDWLDLVSNGIKIRNTSDGANENGQTYIYMVWGQPIVSNSGIASTAR